MNCSLVTHDPFDCLSKVTDPNVGAVADIDNLFLEIKGVGLNYRIELLPNTITLALPIGLLKPITQYTLSLGAKKTTDSQGSYRESARVITFTTGTI